MCEMACKLAKRREMLGPSSETKGETSGILILIPETGCAGSNHLCVT